MGRRVLAALVGVYLVCLGLPLPSLGKKHIIVSTPSSATIWYSNSTDTVEDPDKVVMVYDKSANLIPAQLNMNWLIGPLHLELPMGLALHREKVASETLPGMHEIATFLFVADPGPDCRLMHVKKFRLTESFGILKAGEPEIVMRDKCVRWITLDALGNLFATCEETNEVLWVPAARVQNSKVVTAPDVLYSGVGPNALQVTAPGGIAVDSFFLYWSNKVMSAKTGSVVKAHSFMPSGAMAMPRVVSLAANTDAGKDYGVCLTGSHVFYTEQARRLYAVGKEGGAIAVISDTLKTPRGCVWDGDGSVYVADREAGHIYGFPGNMQKLRAFKKLKRVATLNDPFSVVVFNSGACLGSVGNLGNLLLLLTASLSQVLF